MTGISFQYNLATIDDIDIVYAIQVKSYSDGKHHERKETIRQILEMGMSYLAIAFINGAPEAIGYALIHCIPSADCPPPHGSLDLDLSKSEYIYVHDFAMIPTYRKTGLAYMFWNEVSKSIQAKAKCITLVALPNAIGFWKRNNFIEAPTQSATSICEYHKDAILMHCEKKIDVIR
jgi:hypothetical protein